MAEPKPSSFQGTSFTLQAQASAANRDVPIFMAHGSDDPVVVLERATTSRTQLEGLGYQVEWQQYPMEHSLCLEEIGDIRDWLGRVLA